MDEIKFEGFVGSDKKISDLIYWNSLSTLEVSELDINDMQIYEDDQKVEVIIRRVKK